MTKSVIINAKNVVAGYKSKVIWRVDTLDIYQGEFVGLLGPNGAGKTTLFRLLLGLNKQLSGELTVFDQQPKKSNKRIGYVPQRRTVDTETRIEALEYVRFGIDGNRWGFSLPTQYQHERTQALEALRTVDALDLARRPLHELSGGEIQRVFLAQALVGKPDILLLDEPLANLDIRRETDFVQLINTIVRERGMTVVLISHDLNPLLPVLDRLIYVANGHVVTGRPDEIVSSKVLSKLYGTPVEVLRDTHGRVAVLGAEEAAHPHG